MLSKILNASTLGGHLWIKETIRHKPGSCPRTCLRWYSSLFSLLLAARSSLTACFSVAFDVLANFLRLSNLQSSVNIFFSFYRATFGQQARNLDTSTKAMLTSIAKRKISKHHNDAKIAAKPELLSLSNCSDLG